MSRPVVLVASPMSPSLMAALEASYDIVRLEGAFEEAAPLLAQRRRNAVQGMVVLGIERLDEAALARFPALRVIACLGSGYDGIDLAAARRRGIVVAHSPGVNAASVADVAIALVIECVRDVPRLRRHLHAGEWNGANGARPQGRRGVTGRNLGIYGLGAIGRKIAQRAIACEMTVGYHGRRRHDDVPYAYFDTLLGLAEWSSVLVLAARADAGNRQIVSRDVLHALGSDGFLVNIARGSLVDEIALIDALRDGTIAGAALDVFTTEPRPPQALLDLANVALSPHIGGVTSESLAKAEATVLANLAAHFAGVPPPHIVRV
jgi:lactate dehydrogenase-like 2-hydroxyacid dehydrogenase